MRNKKIFRSWRLFVFCLIFLLSSIHNQLPAQRYRHAEEPTLTRILFIFDASRSMIGQWESGVKIDIARRLLTETLDSLQNRPNLQVALRVYGHQYDVPPQVCDDSKLEVPFAFDNIDKIKQRLETIVPRGTTPIAYSLEQCAKDFPPCDHCNNVVILITDGKEECYGDPCKMSMALLRKNIKLRPFIIGIGLDVETKNEFECVGKFYDADKEKQFKSFLEIIINHILKKTTVQVDLLDIEGKPTETNVNFTLYDQKEDEVIENYIHTFNELGNSDTMTLDPVKTYSITVHTIPPVTKKDIRLNAGKHNTISLKTPQGQLKIAEEKGSRWQNVYATIQQKNDCKILNYQQMSETERYLVGEYELEIYTLPHIKEAIRIEQSKLTSIIVPEAGVLTVDFPALGYGSLYHMVNNKPVWIKNLDNSRKEILNMLPGKYMIVYRSANSKTLKYVSRKKFQVTSGRSVYVSF